MTFNGTSNTINFTVSNKSTSRINVTANTTGFAVGLYDYSITITGNHSDTQVGSSAIAAQVNIQSTPGPFLVVTIDTFSSSVTKGQAGVEFSASVQNLGTSDASGVWLAWEPPAEFTLASGTLNRSIGNLIIGASASNTITINVNSTAPDTTVTITASSNSTQGSGDKKSKTVTIGTPITTTVTTTISGGGVDVPVLVSQPTLPEGISLLPRLPPLEMIRGTNYTFTVSITNPFENSTLENFGLSITGYPAENLIIEPLTVGGIGFGETREFQVTIVVPPTEGTIYTLELMLAGNVSYRNYPTAILQTTGDVRERQNISLEFIETRTMTLIVHGEVFPTYAPTVEEVESLLQIPSTAELVRGSEILFQATVKNPYPNSFLEDLALSISGYPSENIKISPDLINGLGYNEIGEFNVKVSAPTYLEKGTYQLRIALAGRIHYPDYPTATSDITGAPLVLRDVSLGMAESKSLPLDLHIISRVDAAEALRVAEETISSMRELGFATNRISSMLRRALLAFGNKDYEGAKAAADEIATTKVDAILVRGLVEDIGSGIVEAEEAKGLIVAEAKNIYNLGLAAFEREDYSTALQRLRDAQSVLALETRGKVNWLKLLLDYWYAVALGSITTVVGLLVSYPRLQAAWIRGRHDDLWTEESTILDLIHRAQDEYYIKGAVSADTYRSTMARYENRLAEIRKSMSELRAKRPGRIGIREDVEALRAERQNLIRLMMHAQERYYNGPMSTTEYYRAVNSFETRMAEVDERMAMIEAAMEQRRRKG